MGKSRAGDCGRLTPFRGHRAASLSYIQRPLADLSAFWEDRHAR